MTRQTSTDPKRGWDAAAICLLLAGMTLAVFGQTLGHGFINCDDGTYVYENPVVQQGLTWRGLTWAFTGAHASNWHPLTWLSHMLDCQLYGLHPAGHHLTNVLLHTATVIALFLVLWQLTGARWRSAFVAALFAIHPLRVESVAWVAERKDVLSGLFFVLTIGAYARYARQPKSWSRYGMVILLFALGLMSKPMLVTLPVVLLLLDYWPLRRVESAQRLIVEKLPLMALSAAACTATLWAQNEAIRASGAISLGPRLANAVMSCVVYLRQMVWPVGLAPLYPFPKEGLPLWEIAVAGAVLAGVTAVALRLRKTQPWLLTGWLWFLVMLLPVVGIIQVGRQAHADRYTYLPQIGIYIGMTWAVAQWRLPKAVTGSLMAVSLIGLMALTWKQTGYWQNSETLWTHTLACTAQNDLAHNNLGSALFQKGEVAEAINQYDEALSINPGYAEAHNNLGIALHKVGRDEEAVHQYELTLEIMPDDAEAHYNLGKALYVRHQVKDAILHFQASLRIEPDDMEVENILAWMLATARDTSLRNEAKAVQLAQEANKLAEGKNPVVLRTLAAALAGVGRFSDAIENAQKSIDLASSSGKEDLARRVNGDLQSYRQGIFPF